jgi:hypothetical protein
LIVLIRAITAPWGLVAIGKGERYQVLCWGT